MVAIPFRHVKTTIKKQHRVEHSTLSKDDIGLYKYMITWGRKGGRTTVDDTERTTDWKRERVIRLGVCIIYI